MLLAGGLPWLRPWMGDGDICGKPVVTARNILLSAVVLLNMNAIIAAMLFGLSLNAGQATHQASVLVELFTSEGCSSCPPADSLLIWLQKNQPVAGVTIIPMSEHVDYWNNSSWQDRFSSPGFSDRQQEYVRSLHVDSPYTPEMVVDGRAEFVGSDKDAALRLIDAAAKQPRADVQVSDVRVIGQILTFDVSVNRLDFPSADHLSDIYVAVTEDALSTRVRGGENSGHLLSHTAVVHELLRIANIIKGASLTKPFSVPLMPGWKIGSLSAVAFVQGRGSRRILGAGIARVSAP